MLKNIRSFYAQHVIGYAATLNSNWDKINKLLFKNK